MNPKIEDFAARIENHRIIEKYSAFDLRLPHRQPCERDIITHDLAQQDRDAVRKEINKSHYYHPSGIVIPPDPDLDIGV